MAALHTVFVSYSRKDGVRVQQAVELLEAGGAEVFRDIDDIQFGDRWEEVIKTKLAEAERVLVFWSRNALNSEWVGREWSIALAMGKRLVPVLLDDTPMPPELGQFHALSNLLAPPGPSHRVWVLGAAGALSVTVLAIFMALPRLGQGPAPDVMSFPPVATLPTPAPDQDLPDSRATDLQPDTASQPSTTGSEPAGSGVSRPVNPRQPPKATAPYQPEQSQQPVMLILLAGIGLLALLGWWRFRRRKQQKQAAGEQFVQMLFEEN